ncbi:MAG: HAMP domain-containing histidine kinase [Candidatus Hydrogenedentes bacterium]|nr:HAMP domain-containing histidine kinase [Candidatus Hydrogenedentota bacterium]
MNKTTDMNTPEVQEHLATIHSFALVGRCVNSVTHDVNNLLGAVMAYAELMGLEAKNGSGIPRMAQEIVGAVKRTSALVNGLAVLAQKEASRPGLVDPSELIGQLLDLRRFDFRSARIAVETILDPDLPGILADPLGLGLALMTLINDAIDTLQEEPRRILRITTRRTKTAVFIEIWNSGPPVPREQRERIFEPMFTTKKNNHRGLSLACARDTVVRQGGDLDYDDELGFLLSLPINSAIPMVRTENVLQPALKV